MAKLRLALEIGGAVANSVGAAFKDVQGRIHKLEQTSNKAKVLKGTIGDTVKLRAEWKRAHEAGAAGADKLLGKLERNLQSLRSQGIEVGRLSREYQRLSREARGADLQLRGHQQLAAGKAGLKSGVGAAVVGAGLAAVPTKISADYQAIIRDIAIKADVVNRPQEVQLSSTVMRTSRDTGMARNDVADLINQLVGAGMELDKAMAYTSVAAKFAVGQGASGVDTASMIMALQQNAKINDPKVMQQALEAIAYQGQAGSFEANDMARWFPQLLAGMEKNGITGLDAVTSLGAMLQVQMKTAGSSNEAANNFKNWMEKIGAGDVVKSYKDAGIDYQASLNTGLQKGMSVIEASMALAMEYVQATDPAKAEKIKAAQAGIDKEVDPEKARAALVALEKTLRTGDLFADMQVKAALVGYSQNRGLYDELKADSQKATGILDKNLAERRETSKQIWSETFQAMDDSMRSVGDAIRPLTDTAAMAITAVAQGLTKLSDNAQPVVAGIAALCAGLVTLKIAVAAVKIGRGASNILRGGLQRTRSSGRTSASKPARAATRRRSVVGRIADRLRAPRPGAGSVSKARPAKRGIVAKGLRALRGVSGSDGQGTGAQVQRVFVVNWGGLAESNGGPGGQGRRGQRKRQRQGKAGARVPRRAPTRLSKPVNTRLGRAVRGVRGVTRGMAKLPAAKLIDVIPGVLDTALNAETKEQKAEGYGAAAGGMAGAWAGAAAGAAIGSVVPVLGTAIGGAIGAALGGLGGESLGGWLGKKLFGDDPLPHAAKQQLAPKTASIPAGPPVPATGAVVRSLVGQSPPLVLKATTKMLKPLPATVRQQFDLSLSMPITVRGDVKEPNQLVRDMETPLRSLIESMFQSLQRELAERQAAAQLFDAAHV